MTTPHQPTQHNTRCADLINVVTSDTKKLPRVVEVMWWDAAGTGLEWESAEETSGYRPEPTVTVGYLWEETDTYLIIVSVINTMHTSQGMVIPTGCIEWTRTIR